MEDLTTIDKILEYLETQIRQRQVVDAHTWLRAAQALNTLMSDEHDKLYDLQQKVANMKVKFIFEGDSVAMAKAKTDASDEYKHYKIQEARIGRIEEMIRLSKIQSRLKDNEQFHQTN